jgi:hypothetical protein
MQRKLLILIGFMWVGFMAQGILADEKPLTDQERHAVFPGDLGPATIDVSKYPAYQQQSYQLFSHSCSICHSLARPINAPYTSYDQWKRYVQQMHLRAQGKLLTQEDANRLVDFLSYDSKIRKIDNKKSFDALQQQLTTRFMEVQKLKSQQPPPSN